MGKGRYSGDNGKKKAHEGGGQNRIVCFWGRVSRRLGLNNEVGTNHGKVVKILSFVGEGSNLLWYHRFLPRPSYCEDEAGGRKPARGNFGILGHGPKRVDILGNFADFAE